MLFGDPAHFGIEAYHEPQAGTVGFGRLAVHIAGEVLGNIREQHVGLGGTAERLRELISSLPRDNALDGKTPYEVFSFLDAALFIDNGQPDEEVRRASDRFHNFIFLTNSCESFDGTNSFIYVAADNYVHIVYRRSDDTLVAGQCSSQAFIAASSRFVEWLDELYRTHDRV